MNLKKLIDEVCIKYGTNEAELKSDRRLKNVVTAKKIIWKVLALDGKSTTYIGAIFNKDHSTVCVGINGLKENQDAYDYAVGLYMRYRDNENLNRSVSKKKYSQIVYDEIRKRVNENQEVTQISKELDLSDEYVLKIVEQIKSGAYKKVPNYRDGTLRKIYI